MKQARNKIMAELNAARLRPILAVCLVALAGVICAWVTK